MSETLWALSEQWKHERAREKNSSGLQTGPWRCKPGCRRCQLQAALLGAEKDLAGAITKAGKGIPSLQVGDFVVQEILGVPEVKNG